MRVLLGSGGFRTPERVAFLAERMRAFFGPIERLLFVPYAQGDHDGAVESMRQRGLDASYRLEGIHRFADPVAAVAAAQGIFVGGGNTFRLLNELYGRGLLGVMRSRVLAGMPYLGVSAGCNVACPTIKNTNDMPIVWPPSLDALGLVPFQVNPHYYSGQNYVKRGDEYHEHFGETRDERLAEFHEMNDATVVGLWEAGTLWVENGAVKLEGALARVFRKGETPLDYGPGSRLDFLLAPRRKLAYVVAATFSDAAVAEEWLAWLRGGHVAEVLAGGAESAEIVEMDAGQGLAFEVRYLFRSREAFAAYERDHAPRLREEGLRRFGPERGVTYRRTTGLIS
jgi:dipeptidase E